MVADGTEGGRRFERLVTKHLGFVVGVLAAKGIRDSDRDDAAQKVFLVALERLHSIEARAERAFLRGVAVRVASHTRRTYQRRGEVGGEDFDTPTTPSFSPDELLRRKRGLVQLSHAVEQLPREVRQVFVMHELLERPLPELAEELGLPLGTVKTRLRRARALLFSPGAGAPSGNPAAARSTKA